MFDKRHQRLKRIAEEIKKMRGGEYGTASEDEPRRVTPEAFMSRFQKIRDSGGTWAHGTIQ